MWRLVLVAVMLAGCDKAYRIEGRVIVGKGAPHQGALPAVVCVGKGGPLESSALYARPAKRDGSVRVTLLCGPAPDELEFPLDEMIIQASMPKRTHVYAWLQPVPAAKDVCGKQGTAIAEIDDRTLDQLVGRADEALGERAPITWPCGRNPTPEMSLAQEIVFDPDHETWSEQRVEQRVLRLQ